MAIKNFNLIILIFLMFACNIKKKSLSNRAMFKVNNKDSTIQFIKKLKYGDMKDVINKARKHKCKIKYYYLFQLSDTSIYYRNDDLIKTCNYLFKYLIDKKKLYVSKSVFMQLETIPVQRNGNNFIEEFKIVKISGNSGFSMEKGSNELLFGKTVCKYVKF